MASRTIRSARACWFCSSSLDGLIHCDSSALRLPVDSPTGRILPRRNDRGDDLPQSRAPGSARMPRTACSWPVGEQVRRLLPVEPVSGSGSLGEHLSGHGRGSKTLFVVLNDTFAYSFNASAPCAATSA